MDQQLPTQSVIADGAGWRLSSVHCAAKVGERHAEERHGHHVIALVQSGTFTYHGTHGRALLHAGALLLGRKDTCYSCGHDHADGDLCLAFQMDDWFFRDLAGEVTGKSGYEFPLSRTRAKTSWLRPFATLQYARNHAARDEKAIAFAEAVIEGLSETLTERPVSLRDELRIGQVLRVIDNEWDEPLDLQHLASIARMSRFHFLRVFRRVTGLTPHQHIISLRLTSAARRLFESHESVTSIAMSCGFGDLSTFNHTFRRVFGHTPTAFRRGNSL
jgi:AraC family transcriptional regulator